MLFASYVFLFAFLPLVLLGYFGLNRYCRSDRPGKIFLCAANFVFYGWFNFSYLWILLASIGVNFLIGRGMYALRGREAGRRTLLAVGLIFDVGLIGYYKYADFFIQNVNSALSLDWPVLHVLLPLGISFFTFQQIAYLINIHSGELNECYDLLTYTLFISFFPQLIAGPIVLPGEMMPQFADRKNRHFNPANFAPGMWLFAVGLAKKLVIADNLAPLAEDMYDLAAQGTVPDILSCWRGVFAYTAQIYYDFSGYCDMAMGLGMMFNIILPLNFNSPYHSLNIQEFWRRWHITLCRFMVQFVYIPMGGSRHGAFRTYLSIMVTFLVSGLWHGAGWTFILWGGLHGLALCVHRLFSKDLKLSLPAVVAWPMTMLFLFHADVIIRSKDLATAGRVFRGLYRVPAGGLKTAFSDFSLNEMSLILIALGIAWLLPNAAARIRQFKPNLLMLTATVILLCVSVLFINRLSPFIYFNF